MTRDALSRLLFDMLRAKKREATADYRWRQAGENGDQAAARDEAAFVDESVLAVLAAFDEANRNTEAVQRVRGLIAEFSNDVCGPKDYDDPDCPTCLWLSRINRALDGDEAKAGQP